MRSGVGHAILRSTRMPPPACFWHSPRGMSCRPRGASSSTGSRSAPRRMRSSIRPSRWCHWRGTYLVTGVNETKGEVMKIFVVGATGALGLQLVPQLVANGHEVVGMTRSASKEGLVRGLGAQPVVADALDPDAVAQAVAGAEPEVIVHQLTALSGPTSLRDARHPERSDAVITTNRLRTEATDHLLAAGRAVG